jgi:hypothetical protein
MSEPACGRSPAILERMLVAMPFGHRVSLIAAAGKAGDLVRIRV